MGGQGLNIGLHDAFNLGFKLASVVHGRCPEALLNSYHDERHPIGARVLRNVLAQAELLRRNDERSQALNAVVAELVNMPEARAHLGAVQSGLGVHYVVDDSAHAHPLVGRRMPDLDLTLGENTTDGATRVSALLHRARPLLLCFDDLKRADVAAGFFVDVVVASTGPSLPWTLPAIGEVVAPAAVLVRPDGYVAWVGGAKHDDNGLVDALTRWCGRR